MWAERAAALNKSADRYAYIRREVPENWQGMVRAILPHFIVSRIGEEQDKGKRNALIQEAIDYPRHDPAWARSFIETMTADTGRGSW